MPKFVMCPVCKSDVKAPREAEEGDLLTCPDCAEEFTPPHLRKKGYDPEAVASYDVGGRDDDEEESTERREKERKAKKLMEAGRQYGRAARANPRPSFFGGPEVLLLIIAASAGLAAVIGFVLAKRFPSIGEGALIIVGYCGLLGIFAWRHLVARR